MQQPATPETRATAAEPTHVPFSSNDVRLSPGEWVVAVIILSALLVFVPELWKRIEPLDAGADYRIPYRLGNDYWAYRRYCGEACRQHKTLAIGDSVVWGHYVGKDQTLSHYLNELAGDQRYANLGVDGIEPAAMAGLVRFYGDDITGRDVILHCNLLWTADKRRDLATAKERPFTHPRVLPQFVPRIPCYRESLAGRIGIVVGREVPFLGWRNHLQIAYFGNSDLPAWTIEHPYDNPARAITLELPSPDEPPSPKPAARPWTAERIAKWNAAWVELETSFQWRFFRETVDVLRRRGNRVFVVLGPFNEHMLTDESLKIYQERKRYVAAWLRENEVPYAVPPVLPSGYYADASHPLREGYRMLAEQLFENSAFTTMNARNGDSPPTFSGRPKVGPRGGQ